MSTWHQASPALLINFLQAALPLYRRVAEKKQAVEH